ncbi:MAG TPA: hypothetical protein PLZ51_10660 [Aggregatilineales bacterium]|nr:hypothetical protein [Aggregatilineales bacterium]
MLLPTHVGCCNPDATTHIKVILILKVIWIRDVLGIFGVLVLSTTILIRMGRIRTCVTRVTGDNPSTSTHITIILMLKMVRIRDVLDVPLALPFELPLLTKWTGLEPATQQSITQALRPAS